MPTTTINPLLLGIVAAPGVPFWDSSGDGLDGYEGADYATNAFDLATLNGIKVPGITRVKCVPKKKIDIPKSTGRDGGPTTDRGHEASRLDITINVWTPSQWQLLQVLLRSIWRPPGAPIGALDMKAITIEHPSCSSPPWSVSSILLETMESVEYTAAKGAILRLKAVQYIPPKAVEVTRKASGSGPPLAKEITQARGSAPARPSTTDAVPVLTAPTSGGGT